MLRVSAERAAAARESPTGRDHRIGCLVVLDPIDDRLEEIEPIEGCGATPAVSHARHEIRPAGVGAHPIEPAGPGRHALVVVDGIERREPWVADAMVVEDLSTAAEEAVEVHPVRCV